MELDPPPLPRQASGGCFVALMIGLVLVVAGVVGGILLVFVRHNAAKEAQRARAEEAMREHAARAAAEAGRKEELEKANQIVVSVLHDPTTPGALTLRIGAGVPIQLKPDSEASITDACTQLTAELRRVLKRESRVLLSIQANMGEAVRTKVIDAIAASGGKSK